MLAIAVLMFVPTTFAQTPTTRIETPKWEVVSVKPCKAVGRGGGRGGGGQGGASGGVQVVSPGTLQVNCRSVIELIRQAYLTFANGQQDASAGFGRTVPITGGPDWTSSFSDLYEVNAKAEGTPSQEMMGGRCFRSCWKTASS